VLPQSAVPLPRPAKGLKSISADTEH
jgi:hypothetical protein